MAEDLDPAATRKVVDSIIDRTAELHRQGIPTEVLTVDNHADGVHLYLRMLREGNPRAETVRELLLMNGGNSSGTGIGCVSWDGSVHLDQFWRHVTLGNVRERKFSEIWTDLVESAPGETERPAQPRDRAAARAAGTWTCAPAISASAPRRPPATSGRPIRRAI